MTKRLLPFRVERHLFRGYPHVTLYYEAIGPTGQKQPYCFNAGIPLDDTTPGLIRDPLGTAIQQMIGEFFELEKSLNDLARQRDDAKAEAHALREEVRTLQQRVSGYEGKLRQIQGPGKRG